jgi:HK97 family phage major capsid protein
LVEYTRELAFTNAAAETAEGETKPEATLTFELASAPVKTIAHWLKLSKQVMDDAPALASYVDTRLRYGVDLRIDQQLLNGNGSGQNIGGLAKAGNHTAFTPASGDNAIDSINRAIYLVAAADYNATAIILNPADWGAIERTKTQDDAYVFGAPQRLAPTLWGLPVVATNTMTAGKFMVGAFDMAAQVWNRQGTVVEMSEADDTNFQKNLVTVRAEARLALAIYRPVSIQYGSLTV